jgi:transcriptional regulator with XRE-family HTH domain
MPKRIPEEEIDPILRAVGKKIRGIRESKKISQEKFALQAGIDRTYYASLERGYRNVSVKNLVKIAYHLEVELGDLFPSVAELYDADSEDLPPK